MSTFTKSLTTEFALQANSYIASQQKAYMRNQFEFYGLKADVRRELSKPFLVKAFLPEKSELLDLVTELWNKPQREFQLFAQELVFKYAKRFEKEDITIIEYMVVNKSWWDTVDYIAVKLMGQYFKLYPDERRPLTTKWLNSNNLWLQRSALLFQLKYKKDLDTELLASIIQPLLGSKEFFINKAIGWVLRDYSRTNPEWVMDFVENTNLEPLSRREAVRLIRGR